MMQNLVRCTSPKLAHGGQAFCTGTMRQNLGSSGPALNVEQEAGATEDISVCWHPQLHQVVDPIKTPAGSPRR